ncbi:DNA-binding protein YbaB [Saccharopolyspora lacisalsi]|uniref:DNA-binding protein YbaB n=1 Tax=Halosaccharopolyspora lacisalsi TaxID=1000566 RepID=A0A839DXA3_9PSEU|nr:YbaB/EbfC family nucleoid-associated protein [Halosaccharopolyspora lacisalsi]MBA8825369.1 DNA-binding protein YbaB [Halosaccharopolyspora lacisalsi]
MDPYQYLADFESKANQMQEQLEQSQEAFSNARGEASSSDGSVTVTVAGGGGIESIDLTARSLELGHTKLASTIMETIRQAQSQAARQVEESMKPLLGDGEAMNFLSEQVEASIARMQPDDEDSAASGGRPGSADEAEPDEYDEWQQRRRRGGTS